MFYAFNSIIADYNRTSYHKGEIYLILNVKF